MAAPKITTPHDLLLVMSGPEERLQIVLGQPGPDGYTLLASRQWTVPGQSVKFLLPGLKEALDGFGLTTKDIAKVACVRGPGSFTGLRLVLAAAEGIAAGNDLPLAGLDYLPLLASTPSKLLNGPLHVLTYARRGLVYLQSFSCPDLIEQVPLGAYSLEDAAAIISESGNQATLMGTGLRKNPEFFTELSASNPGYTLLDGEYDNPSPEALLSTAAKAVYSEESIDPIYVRASDAEENLPFIARKRGLDPEEARKRLDELQKS